MPANNAEAAIDDTVHFHYEGEDCGPYNEVIRLNQATWKYDLDTETFLRHLPKVELHVHLDGAFDPTLLFNHLKETGQYESLPENVVLPWDKSPFPVRAPVEQCETVESFHSLITCRGKRSLQEMMKCFEIFIPIVRGKLDLIEMLAHDFVRRQAKQNIIYSEVRYCPQLLAKGGDYVDGGHDDGDGDDGMDVAAGPVIDAVTRGLRKGERDFGVKVNQILCCIAWRPDYAKEVIELAHARRDDTPCAIVGVDIAAGEDHFDKNKHPQLHDPHYEAFQRAQELDLNITIHAGEVGDSAYVRKAVDEYGATRIGHGYSIACEPDIMEEMRKKNIHFEVCPTSSDETGGWSYDETKGRNWKEHPAIAMIRYGLNVGFNSDDPAVFDTSLTWQYRVAVGKMGLTTNCVLRPLYDSIDAAFLDDDSKAVLRARVDKYTQKERPCCSL